MKKYGKITAVLLALVMVMSLFAACRKDDNNEEETTTEGFTLQLDNGEGEMTEESTTQSESTTEVATKEEKTTKVKPTVKVPTITKAPTTKASGTTKAPTPAKPEDKNTTVAQPTKPAVTEKEELKVTNIDLLLGTWDSTVDVDGLPIRIQFEFSIFGKTVNVDFTKDSYDNMLEKAVEINLSKVTDEELAEAGFADRAEYEKELRAYLIAELPYDELRSMFQSTGRWELIGDKLTIVIDGETMTANTQLSDDVRSFELVDAYGEKMTLIKR